MILKESYLPKSLSRDIGLKEQWESKISYPESWGNLLKSGSSGELIASKPLSKVTSKWPKTYWKGSCPVCPLSDQLQLQFTLKYKILSSACLLITPCFNHNKTREDTSEI